MRIPLSLSLWALVACEAPPATFSEVLPDERLLLHEEEFVPIGSADVPSEWATWLLDEARASNQRHTELVLLLEAITVLPANYHDLRRERGARWGPWIIDDTAEQLWIDAAGDDAYTWAIERQTVDPDRVRLDDDAWIAGLTGTIEATGSTPIGGRFVIDVDEVGFGIVSQVEEAVLQSADVSDEPGETAPVGRAALHYTFSPTGATFTTFGGVRGNTVPDRGGVTFHHVPGDGGTVEATLHEDRDGDGSDEEIAVRVAWAANRGGRADLVVTSATGTTTTAECWGPDHRRVWSSTGEGDVEACPVAAP